MSNDGANSHQAPSSAQMNEGPTFLEDDGSVTELPHFVCFTNPYGLRPGETIEEARERWTRENQKDKGRQIALPPPQENKRRWTDEDVLNYDLARDAIGGLISILSAEKYAEEKKDNPDQERLERMRAETSRLFQERRELHIEDHEKIARIRTAYGAAYRFYHVIAQR